MTRWTDIAGTDHGDAYAARFAQLAATGRDMHGEARFVASLVAPPARILDAGCGTGRVMIRLAELGYDCVGVDVDPSMLRVARRTAPALTWLQTDLARLELDRTFDLVVMAGNIIPLLDPGTVDVVAARLATHLAEGGVVVAGFGLDAAHLPPGCPVTPLSAYDAAMGSVGLELNARFATWDGDPCHEESYQGGYAVSVHTRVADNPVRLHTNASGS